jgi:SAM-dependent methyltransferase
MEQNREIFCCPQCRKDLAIEDQSIHCTHCGRSYPIQHDIPMMFSPNEWSSSKEDVTEEIRAFYEENPFPDYDEFDSASSLIDKAREGLFAKLLDDQIPFGTRVLECGCGTGQLTNFLAVANRTVIGTDLCMNSLKLAKEFREKNGLDRAHFFQMNLFRPCFRPMSFDLVISNGVLHHTSDPSLGFQSIASLVRPGGYIVVGLYDRYGRTVTRLRREIFKATKDRLRFLDKRAVERKTSEAKRRSWFMDQYKNPHESTHTLGDVLPWLEEAGFEFIRSIPKTVPFSAMDREENLFRPERMGNRFERAMVNMTNVFTGHGEGGFFVVVARKS